jgi:hypothetical protein
MSRIAILGAGAWGTAIALALDRRGGHKITLWSHSADEAGQIAAAQENVLFPPASRCPRTSTLPAALKPSPTPKSSSPSSLPSSFAPPSPVCALISTPAKSSSPPPRASRTTPVSA